MTILFLCTGNSCRSQMAEGFARHFGGGRFAVDSAGLEAHGLNPQAVAAMAEIGIDISAQRSKVIDAAMIDSADLIVTVCDYAREHCPVVPTRVRQLHWSFDDPAKATGTPEEVRAVFRRVRDEIGARVRALVESL
ncbi:MAG TPA: arsenate reductase (thioredoxin) [bacterium]|nr:arsenate reductase (thioredoxin) [bacterium]